MGEARKRGTRKQRVANARKNARRIWDEQWQPVDPATFRMAFGIWCAAASRKMPVENPELRRFVDGDTGIVNSFTDMPLNRALITVARELREIGIKDPQPYMTRLVEMQELFDRRHDLLADYFVLIDGQLMIDDDLLTAAATARFVIPENDSDGGLFRVFDLADVLQKAHEAAMQASMLDEQLD